MEDRKRKIVLTNIFGIVAVMGKNWRRRVGRESVETASPGPDPEYAGPVPANRIDGIVRQAVGIGGVVLVVGEGFGFGREPVESPADGPNPYGAVGIFMDDFYIRMTQAVVSVRRVRVHGKMVTVVFI